MPDSDQPPFASKLPRMNNAWIFLNEDNPAGTTYNSPSSQYQRIIGEGLYQLTDLLNLCFVDIVPTSADTIPAGDGSSYTLFLDHVTHPPDRGGGVPTNQDYMEWIVRDARKANPKIKILLTLLYGKQHLISQIFPDPANPDSASAEKFARNVLAYLQHYDLDGFDIDWEWHYLSDDTTRPQFKAAFSAVGAALKSAGMLLTMGPATTNNLDPATVNEYFDVIAFQMYYSTTLPGEFVDYGIEPDAFAYGAKFESQFQSAENAHAQMQAYGFKAVTTWRLNSSDYVYEQDQYKILAGLVKP